MVVSSSSGDSSYFVVFDYNLYSEATTTLSIVALDISGVFEWYGGWNGLLDMVELVAVDFAMVEFSCTLGVVVNHFDNRVLVYWDNGTDVRTI